MLARTTSQKRKKLALGVGPIGSNFSFCEEIIAYRFHRRIGGKQLR
jgi:hypothetical protein